LDNTGHAQIQLREWRLNLLRSVAKSEEAKSGEEWFELELLATEIGENSQREVGRGREERATSNERSGPSRVT